MPLFTPAPDDKNAPAAVPEQSPAGRAAPATTLVPSITRCHYQNGTESSNFFRVVTPASCDSIPIFSGIVENAKRITMVNSRHPHALMVLFIIRHRDQSYEMDVEYADAGPLDQMIPFFPENLRAGVAKSVARQILSGLHYYQIVCGEAHGALNPAAVFLRSDGCVKLDFLRMNCTRWYDAHKPGDFVIPSSLFCAPEYRSHGPQLQDPSKADIWAVGMLIVAIMKGMSLLLSPEKSAYEYEIAKLRHDEAAVEHLIKHGSNAMWSELIPDPDLRDLTRRCLALDPNVRPTLEEANAFIMRCGGLKTPDENREHPNPWATDPKALKYFIADSNPVTLESFKQLFTSGAIEQSISQLMKKRLTLWCENRTARPEAKKEIDKERRAQVKELHAFSLCVMKGAVLEVVRLAQLAGACTMPTFVNTMPLRDREKDKEQKNWKEPQRRGNATPALFSPLVSTASAAESENRDTSNAPAAS